MLILLPPSEGKTAPRRGAPIAAESWPEDLHGPRTTMLDALIHLCESDPHRAAEVLELGPSQAAEVTQNASLRSAPTAPAGRIYTGVLYDHLDLPTLSTSAKRRAARRLMVTSALFGVVGINERIPAYRLSGGVTLPGLGTVASHWRTVLDPVLRSAIGSGLLVDLRSSTYAGFWKPGPDLKVATIRVLNEQHGKRSVVSHFNKATKGDIVRALLEDGRDARTPTSLANLLTELGWRVELVGARLDVILTPDDE